MEKLRRWGSSSQPKTIRKSRSLASNTWLKWAGMVLTGNNSRGSLVWASILPKPLPF